MYDPLRCSLSDTGSAWPFLRKRDINPLRLDGPADEGGEGFVVLRSLVLPRAFDGVKLRFPWAREMLLEEALSAVHGVTSSPFGWLGLLLNVLRSLLDNESFVDVFDRCRLAVD